LGQDQVVHCGLDRAFQAGTEAPAMTGD
jgi:hypothetical protein